MTLLSYSLSVDDLKVFYTKKPSLEQAGVAKLTPLQINSDVMQQF